MAGAIRSLWLSYLDVTEIETAQFPTDTITAVAVSTVIANRFGLCNHLATFLELFKYLTAQLRVSALGASSLLDCYNVDSQLAQLRSQKLRELQGRCA